MRRPVLLLYSRSSTVNDMLTFVHRALRRTHAPFGSECDVALSAGFYLPGLEGRALFEAYVESFPVTWNMHFFLQVAFCGAPLESSTFDFVGVMNATFKEQLDVLRRHPKAPPAFQDAVTVRFVLLFLGRRAVLVKM